MIFLLRHHVNHLAFEYQRKGFVGLQAESAIFVTPVFQLLRDFRSAIATVLQIGGSCYFGRARRPCPPAMLQRVVLQLRVVANQRAINLAGGDVTIAIHTKSITTLNRS